MIQIFTGTSGSISESELTFHESLDLIIKVRSGSFCSSIFFVHYVRILSSIIGHVLNNVERKSAHGQVVRKDQQFLRAGQIAGFAGAIASAAA